LQSVVNIQKSQVSECISIVKMTYQRLRKLRHELVNTAELKQAWKLTSMLKSERTEFNSTETEI